MTGNSAISNTIGTIVYVLVIVPVAIAALQALQISAISDPAVYSAGNDPGRDSTDIIGAALVLGIAYLIARWVAGLVEELLPGLGVDRSVGAMGICQRSNLV